MAKGWKRAAELALHRSGMLRVAERRRRPSVVILAYHNIVPAGEDVVGDVSLHVDQKAFGNQLDWLLDGREIVALEDLFHDPEDPPTDPVSTGAPDGTRVAITFDDAYRGTMTAGLEELAKRGLPSTVFVPPGLLGSEGFWWDRLAAAGAVPLDPAIREHALEVLRGRTDDVLAWAQQQGLRLRDLPDHACPVSEEELLSNPHLEQTTLGAHTWSHPNLARLDEASLRDELERSRSWLAGRSDRYVDCLAYPYGLTSPSVEQMADAIFDASLLVSGGAAVARGERTSSAHRVPRINVPRGLSVEGLALRLAGFGG